MNLIVSNHPDEATTVGRDLGARLVPGTVVALAGDLGAGKTHFVRGLVAGWGGTEPATSPTFTLLHEYATPRGPVFHLDLYRAKTAAEVWEATHDELSDATSLVVIEWADRFPELVPPNACRVSLIATGQGRREITIEQ